MNHQNMFINKEPSSHQGSKVLRIIGMVFMGVLFAAGFALVFGLLVMWLWNWLMPALFGLGEITYWQAFGILLLAKLFFGGFGSHKREPSNHFHDRFHSRWNHLKDRKNVDSWKDFRQFWKDEGKARYQEYAQKKQEEKDDKSSEKE
ncbi:MAG TPA: hypothetical protein VFG01_12030 [Acidobacteriota bacterium]|nr:hypothetical protein [Acidobacteriota bacterium]